MSDRTYAKVQAQQKTLTGSPSKSSLLQRICACGQHTIAGGECATCRNERSTLLRSQKAFGSPSAPSPTQENVPSLNYAFNRSSRFGHDFSRIPVYSSPLPALQTKLKINQPGDVYEQEADQVAEQVMRMVDLKPSASDNEDEMKNSLIHTELGANTATGSPDVSPIVHTVLNSGGGQPLDTTTRAFMEPRFGHDFSQVRVHNDERAAESARAVNALAYTVGRNLVFGERKYAPETEEGRHLLAHELTHVVQQEGGASASEQRNEHFGQKMVNQSYIPISILSHSRVFLQRESDAGIPMDLSTVSGGTPQPDQAAGTSKPPDKSQQQEMQPTTQATPAPASTSPPWYKPWLEDASFSPNSIMSYKNVEAGTRTFDTEWKKNALDTALLSVAAGTAATTGLSFIVEMGGAIAAVKLSLKELIGLAGGAFSVYRSLRSWQVQEHIVGQLVQVHSWYGRYRINLVTGKIKAVDFKGRGPSELTLSIPYFYQQRLIEGETGRVIYTHRALPLRMPGVDPVHAHPLPEYSFGTFD